MSLISTESSLDTAFKPPSLVFPSLHSNSHTNASKYSSKDATNLNSNNNNNEDHSANSKNLQSCIHYASRLIKLRSELRSPSYMNRSNSISESGGDTIGQLFYKSNCTTFGNGRNGRNSSLYELSSAHKSSIDNLEGNNNTNTNSKSDNSHSPSLLSDIGRAQSLPNVTQQQSLYHYDKEDESEIFSHHYNKMMAATTTRPKAAETENDDEQDDEASQLTYLSDLVRASLRRRQTHFHETSDHLALPPRHHFHNAPKEPRPRSISLRDMINEAIDEAIQSTSSNDSTTADKPTVLRNSQSFTLASQLLFHASQNSSSQQQRQKTDQEKGQEQQQQPHQEQEKENLFLDTTNVKNSLAITNDKFKEVIPPAADNYHGAFDEKVEIPSQVTNRATSGDSSSTFHQCNKQHSTTTTSAAPMPQPNEEDDDDTKTSLSIHSFNKRIIQKRRLQKRPQAFLVSISPSSAAAASVARSRRSKTKQAIRAHHHLNSLLN
ncbi:hypothetical protein MBANPS3_012209 [Mucor bainieri]